MNKIWIWLTYLFSLTLIILHHTELYIVVYHTEICEAAHWLYLIMNVLTLSLVLIAILSYQWSNIWASKRWVDISCSSRKRLLQKTNNLCTCCVPAKLIPMYCFLLLKCLTVCVLHIIIEQMLHFQKQILKFYTKLSSIV